MTDLIARIEAAQPSKARGLFEEAAVTAWGVEAGEVVINDTALYERMCRFDDLLDAQAYLDAAAMFVPEGWRLRQMNFSAPCADDRKWHINLHGGREGEDRFTGRGTTPALALAAAALKARGV